MLLGYIGLNLKTRRYFYLSGRSPRSEYVIYYLFLSAISLLLLKFGSVPIIILTGIFAAIGFPFVPMIFLLGLSLYLALPLIFISIRRMHDIGVSGVWVFVPILLALAYGAIIILNTRFGYNISMKIADFLTVLASVTQVLILAVSVFIKGSEGDNKYGPNPMQ